MIESVIVVFFGILGIASCFAISREISKNHDNWNESDEFAIVASRLSE